MHPLPPQDRAPRWVLALTILAAACSSGPSDPATLVLGVSTSGTNPDPDGYTYALDGGEAVPLASDDFVIVAGLNPGLHEVVLEGVADNCTVQGGNSHSFTLPEGDTTDVLLQVDCGDFSPTIIATVPLPGAPYGVAVSTAGVIYAAQIGSTTLARGDLATRSFTGSVVVGDTPPHVVLNPAGTTAYATLQTGQAVAVVDVASNTLTTTVPLAGDGFNLIVAPNGQRVYATTDVGTLYVINATTNTVVTTLQVGAAANGLAFSPDGTVLYVSSRDAGTVVAVDPQSNTITRTYTLGGMPQRLAVAPDGSKLYVANEVSGLDVVDVATGAVNSISFQTAGYGLGLSPNGSRLYVLLPQAGEVRVINRETLAPVKTIFVGGVPRNVVFASDGTALVTNEEAVVFIR